MPKTVRCQAGDLAMGEKNLYIVRPCLFMRFWLILILTFLLCLVPVSATNQTTISFNDLNLAEHNDLEIYGLNETTNDWSLLAIYNTTSDGLIFEPGNYQIVVKGTAVSRLFNPSTMLLDAFSFLETYWMQIILAFGIIAIILRKW